ncbi:hypothetical protein DER44DRAFT_827521 [Fusarium oxysporum]|nr:hypothetical protein DER44DRAFT_827521 [Fusarium oxysporum]
MASSAVGVMSIVAQFTIILELNLCLLISKIAFLDKLTVVVTALLNVDAQ